MLNRKNDLIAKRGLSNTLDCSESQVAADNLAFINQISLSIVGSKSQLPIKPGFEMHL
jgi:hypothetical protein